MNLDTLLNQLKNQPSAINFPDVIAVIDAYYDYSPATFKNGNTTNDAGSNEGSCKVFAFAKAHDLNEKQTLALFGQFYFNDVLNHPKNTDHANIRNFMETGWKGISFEQSPLKEKAMK